MRVFDCIPSKLLLLSSCHVLRAEIYPKMNAKPITDKDSLSFGRRRLESEGALPPDFLSSIAIYSGTCNPHKEFTFRISSGSGKGMAIALSDTAMESFALNMNLVYHDSNKGKANLLVSDIVHANPLTLGLEYDVQNSEYSWGTSFTYQEVSPTGASISIDCPNQHQVGILVFVRDGSDLLVAANVLSASTHGKIRVGLLNDVEGQSALFGQVMHHPGKDHELNDRKLLEITQTNTTPAFSEESTTGISIHTETIGTRPILLHVALHDNRQNIVYRTFVAEPHRLATLANLDSVVDISLLPVQVDDNGDFLLELGISNNTLNIQNLHVEARIGILTSTQNNTAHAVVDMSAIVPAGKAKILVHPAWFKLELERMQMNVTNDFDIVVLGLDISDPDSGTILYRSSEMVIPGFADSTTNVNGDQFNNSSIGTRFLLRTKIHGDHKHRALAVLKSPLTNEERTHSLEMQEGRRPVEFDYLHRDLKTYKGKKILVHGYCATNNPFPKLHFSNEIAFKDPDGYSDTPNWSNDKFARKINRFARQKGINGCSCIGHSQGGTACLHLKTFYFSCLDNSQSGGNALMQSVGTPYQGTYIAAEAAMISAIFKIGCGSNYDLTYKGASIWLDRIPQRVRRQMNFYTTSGSMCQPLTDILLADPEDGVTERNSGTLSGGKNQGHSYGQCHTQYMTEDAQTKDSNRNQIMNRRASF